MKAEEEKKDSQKEASQSQASQATTAEQKDSKAPSKTSTSTNPEHDLDVFLLGDLGSDDEGPGILFTSLDLIQLLSLYILLQFLYMTCSIDRFQMVVMMVMTSIRLMLPQ